MPGSTKCTPYFRVVVNEPPEEGDVHQPWSHRQVFCFREALHQSGEELKPFDCSQRYLYLDCSKYRVSVSGEVGIKFYAAHHVGKSERMCQVWFHTAFIKSGHRLVQFNKNRIDGAHKDKKCRRFSTDFAMQFFLHTASGEELSTVCSTQWVSEHSSVGEPSSLKAACSDLSCCTGATSQADACEFEDQGLTRSAMGCDLQEDTDEDFDEDEADDVHGEGTANRQNRRSRTVEASSSRRTADEGPVVAEALKRTRTAPPHTESSIWAKERRSLSAGLSSESVPPQAMGESRSELEEVMEESSSESEEESSQEEISRTSI